MCDLHVRARCRAAMFSTLATLGACKLSAAPAVTWQSTQHAMHMLMPRRHVTRSTRPSSVQTHCLLGARCLSKHFVRHSVLACMTPSCASLPGLVMDMHIMHLRETTSAARRIAAICPRAARRRNPAALCWSRSTQMASP